MCFVARCRTCCLSRLFFVLACQSDEECATGACEDSRFCRTAAQQEARVGDDGEESDSGLSSGAVIGIAVAGAFPSNMRGTECVVDLKFPSA